MSFRLNNDTRIRIVDNNNNDITVDKSKFDETKDIKIQIDIDKDGKFDGKNDINIIDKNQIKLLTDNIKGNSSVLINIPFVNEIEEHLLKVNKITELLEEAKNLGQKAKETSIFEKSKKIKLGKDAFNKLKEAFFEDKSNTVSKFNYGMTIYRIKTSSWKSLAENTLNIKCDQEAKENIIPELEKDKYDICGQMLLKEYYKIYQDKKNEERIKNLLFNLRQQFPEEYKKSEDIFKKAIGE